MRTPTNKTMTIAIVAAILCCFISFSCSSLAPEAVSFNEEQNLLIISYTNGKESKRVDVSNSSLSLDEKERIRKWMKSVFHQASSDFVTYSPQFYFETGDFSCYFLEDLIVLRQRDRSGVWTQFSRKKNSEDCEIEFLLKRIVQRLWSAAASNASYRFRQGSVASRRHSENFIAPESGSFTSFATRTPKRCAPSIKNLRMK